MAPWTALQIGDRTWVRLPDVDARRRWLCIGTGDPGVDGSVDAALWRWLDIRSGLPRIVTATQDRFVPQMLNLEALGGVDFKKGCYPGQEVVARSQYLGKLKRTDVARVARRIGRRARARDRRVGDRRPRKPAG